MACNDVRATALHSALMEAQVQKEMLVNAKRSATMQKKADTKAAMMLNRKENVLEQRMLEVVLSYLLSNHIYYSMNES